MAFAPMAIAAAAGAALFWAYDKKIKPYLPFGKPFSPGGSDKLKKGSRYGILVTLNPIGTASEATAASYLRSYFEQVGFFQVSDPRPQDSTQAGMFANGQASAWVLDGHWGRDEPYVQGPANPAIGMAVFHEVPAMAHG